MQLRFYKYMFLVFHKQAICAKYWANILCKPPLFKGDTLSLNWRPSLDAIFLNLQAEFLKPKIEVNKSTSAYNNNNNNKVYLLKHPY